MSKQTLATCILDLRASLLNFQPQKALEIATSSYTTVTGGINPDDLSVHYGDVSFVRGYFYSNDYCITLQKCVGAESFLYDPITGSDGEGVCELQGLPTLDSSDNS